MASTPEGKVKKLVRDAVATWYPNSYRFCPVQNGMGKPGLDFYYCIRGKFVAVETKRETDDYFYNWDTQFKKATPRQQETMLDIAAAGGLTYVIDGPTSLTYMLGDLADQL